MVVASVVIKVGELFTIQNAGVVAGESGGRGLVKTGLLCWLLKEDSLLSPLALLRPKLLTLLLMACVFLDLSGPPTLLLTSSSISFSSPANSSNPLPYSSSYSSGT